MHSDSYSYMKRKINFFMHLSMQSHLKNQKNMVLMYSPMHSHIKKKSYLHFHIIIQQSKMKKIYISYMYFHHAFTYTSL